MHPARACALIRDQARLAVASAGTAPQVAVALPATLRIQFKSSDHAELAARVRGVARTATLTAEIGGVDPLELYRTFITIVLLCRGLVE
jgi:D-amino peptidase